MPPRVDGLVQGSRRPRLPGVTLRGLGAAVAQRDEQLVQVGPRQLLRGEMPVLFAQRGQAVRVAVDRRRAGVVQRGEPVRAQLLDRHRLARHEGVGGRLLADLGQRIAGLLLGGVTAAHLLALTRFRVHPRIDRKLISHNGFPGLAVESPRSS